MRWDMNNYNALTIANFIIWFVNNHTPNRNLTPLKLQKILYYVQANHLALNNGVPLFSDLIEKLQYGPVVPSVYHEFKDFGINHISTTRSMLMFTDSGFDLIDFKPEMVDNATQIEVANIVNNLINLNPFDLVERTHKEVMWSDHQDVIMSGVRGLTYDNLELTNYFRNKPII